MMRRQERLQVACLCGWVAAFAASSVARADEKGGHGEQTATPAAVPGARGAPDEAKDEGDAGDEKHLKGYSPYERATIRSALAKLKAVPDPIPEGKRIERIDVIRLDVIEDRDPAPNFLNWFHATSRSDTIEREALLRVGDVYRQALADETARNLREFSQLSLVLCFAVTGSRPDKTRLVVITKDVWSLRLNWDLRFAGGRFEYLVLQPSEENLLGAHHSASARFQLDLATYSLGARYIMPRIGGSHIRLRAEANVIVNRGTGEAEGSFGEFIYGQPLYSTQAKWAWGATMRWRNEMFRRFCVAGKSACAGDLRGFDAPATPEDDAIPYTYRSDTLSGDIAVTRSMGADIKHNASLGVEVSSRRYRAPDLASYSPAAAAEFNREVVPVSDTRIGPFLSYRTASTTFLQVLELETLGLQEDVRLGHEAIIKIAPFTTPLNSTRNLFHLFAAARYAAPLGDGLAVAFAESSIDIEAERLPDASIEAGGSVITPRLGFGRLVVDGRVLHRYRNYLNRTASLGGNSRLRGYPTGAFLGKDAVVANLELRTRPLEILSCQLGGVLFFDVGDAFDGAKDFQPKQSAGFGFRILFPQLNRVVFRADWGFPLTRGYREPDSFPGDIVVTFRQAFPVPEIPTNGAEFN